MLYITRLFLLMCILFIQKLARKQIKIVCYEEFIEIIFMEKSWYFTLSLIVNFNSGYIRINIIIRVPICL